MIEDMNGLRILFKKKIHRSEQRRRDCDCICVCVYDAVCIA